MADFEKAFFKLIQIEGEYSNDPDDSGGETKYGITKKIAERNGWNIENLSLADAKYAYYNYYWIPLACDKILHQELAEQIFDMGVNCGIKNAGKAIQTALNLLNRNNLSWLDLIVDGLIGPKTLKILNSLSEEDIKYCRKIFAGERYCYYKTITLSNPKNKKFFRGWINRIKI